MYYKQCIVLALIAFCCIHARTTAGAPQNSVHEEQQQRSDETTSSTSYVSDLRYMYKAYQECSASDLMSCLKLKLVAALDRVARNYVVELPIFDGISFVQDPKSTNLVGNVNHVKTEAELEAELPRSLNERDNALNTLIVDKITGFLDTHSLQIKLPTVNDMQRSFNGGEEARKKKNRGGALLLLPLILGGTLIPLALGALALLAGKALIVSKLALVLAGIIGLKKLLSGHSGGHDSGHVEVVAGHGSGWGRSYDKEQAQNLAYSAYAPKTSS